MIMSFIWHLFKILGAKNTLIFIIDINIIDLFQKINRYCDNIVTVLKA